MDANLYYLIKSLHIISFTAWMAGLFYLPRLFVYHVSAAKGGELSEALKIMEHRLLRYIMNPAMIATFIFGIWLVVITGIGGPGTGGWIHVKILLVLLLASFHGACSAWRKRFATDANEKSEKFFRIANEVPTLALIAIVFLAIFKPF